MVTKTRQKVGIIGSGAAGLSAAWLLADTHDVTLLEQDLRLGGHAHTAWIDPVTNKLADMAEVARHLQHRGDTGAGTSLVAVDTGFIVFNQQTYPNFCEWLHLLGVRTEESNMSFSVSRDNGKFEYSGGTLKGLFAQPANLFKPRFWSMLGGLVRFYRDASSADIRDDDVTLGEFLNDQRYSRSFIDDHLLPFGAAIWSTSQANMLDYPVSAFIKFCDNHSLLKLTGRPKWRTLSGASATYVNAVQRTLTDKAIRCNFKVTSIDRSGEGVTVFDTGGQTLEFNQVIFACHADQALRILGNPHPDEQRLLGVFKYDSNRTVLHTDTSFLPLRRAAWSSWNYVEQGEQGLQAKPGVSYWMNRLQNLPGDIDYIVSLNPSREPDPTSVLRTSTYEHPVFTAQTYHAQQQLWTLQGQRKCWFCGSYFGAGFHEDALQSGFAVAEQLGGGRRPWSVENESSRIFVTDPIEAERADVDKPALLEESSA